MSDCLSNNDDRSQVREIVREIVRVTMTLEVSSVTVHQYL